MNAYDIFNHLAACQARVSVRWWCLRGEAARAAQWRPAAREDAPELLRGGGARSRRRAPRPEPLPAAAPRGSVCGSVRALTRGRGRAQGVAAGRGTCARRRWW